LGDHLIAEAGDGGDVRGLAGIVAELTPERGDGLVNRVGRDGHVGPDAGEQVVDGDDLAGALGEAEEQAQCAGLETDRFLATDDLAGRLIDGPVADAEGAVGSRCE
jgi:hypothetical protein